MKMMMLYNTTTNNTRDMVRNVNQILLSKDKLVLLPFIIIIVVIIYKTDKKKWRWWLSNVKKLLNSHHQHQKKYDMIFTFHWKEKSINQSGYNICVCVTKFMIFCNYKKILFTYKKKNPPATRCHNWPSNNNPIYLYVWMMGGLVVFFSHIK